MPDRRTHKLCYIRPRSAALDRDYELRRQADEILKKGEKMKCQFCDEEIVGEPRVCMECRSSFCRTCFDDDIGNCEAHTTIECPGCSEAGGADRSVEHLPPACKP